MADEPKTHASAGPGPRGGERSGRRRDPRGPSDPASRGPGDRPERADRGPEGAGGERRGRERPQGGERRRGDRGRGPDDRRRDRDQGSSPLKAALFSSFTDKEVPCRVGGCPNTWTWFASQQIRSLGQPPPERMCDEHLAQLNELADAEVPCRNPGCTNTWTWKRGAQLALLQKTGKLRRPSRLCDECFAAERETQDVEVPCKVDACHRTWTWTRDAQLRHGLWVRRQQLKAQKAAARAREEAAARARAAEERAERRRADAARGEAAAEAPASDAAVDQAPAALVAESPVLEDRSQGFAADAGEGVEVEVAVAVAAASEPAASAEAPAAADAGDGEAGEAHDAEAHDAEAHDAEAHDAEAHDAEAHDAEAHEGEAAEGEATPGKRKRKRRRRRGKAAKAEAPPPPPEPVIPTGPPARMCSLCAQKVARLQTRELPCKVHGCTGTWTWDRAAQLRAWAALGTDDLEVEPTPPRRMCESCRDFCRKHPDRQVACGRPGCEHTWSFKTGAQLQASLAGRTDEPLRLCDECARGGFITMQTLARGQLPEGAEVMPCVVPGCTSTWVWFPGQRLGDRKDDQGLEIDKMCLAHRHERGFDLEVAGGEELTVTAEELHEDDAGALTEAELSQEADEGHAHADPGGEASPADDAAEGEPDEAAPDQGEPAEAAPDQADQAAGDDASGDDA